MHTSSHASSNMYWEQHPTKGRIYGSFATTNIESADRRLDSQANVTKLKIKLTRNVFRNNFIYINYEKFRWFLISVVFNFSENFSPKSKTTEIFITEIFRHQKF